LSETSFFELQNQLFELFSLEKLDEVHSLIEKAEKDYPDRLDKTLFWKACVFSLQGKEEQAILALDEGLQRGIWWNPTKLTVDEDLKRLQSREDFKGIVNRCKEILENQQQKSSPELFIFGNERSETGIFSLHWRGSNVKDFAPYWFDESLLNQFLLVFPQSSQIFGYNAYCWDDQQIAVKDVSDLFGAFKKKYRTKQDIIAGASQGGKLAIELCLKEELLETKGFIAVIPAIHDVSGFENLLKGNGKPKKGCIITGNQDPFYKKTVELVKMFEAQQFPCKLIVKEGLGHFFPDDFPKLLKDAITFVLT